MDFNFYAVKIIFSITINWICIQLTDGVEHCPIALRNCHLPWFQPLCWWIFFPSSLGRYLPNLWVLAQTWPPRKLFLLLRQGPRGLSKWTVFVEGFVLDFTAAALSTTLSWKQCIIWRHEYGHFWSVILSLWNNYRFATKWQKLFKGYLYIYIDNFPYFYY